MWILVAVLLAAPLVEYPYAPGGVVVRFASLPECVAKAHEMQGKLDQEDVPPFKLSCKPV